MSHVIDLTFGDCRACSPFINCLFPFNRHLNLPLHINCWNPTEFGAGLSGIERKNASLMRPLRRVALQAYVSLPEFGDPVGNLRYCELHLCGRAEVPPSVVPMQLKRFSQFKVACQRLQHVLPWP